MGSTELRIAARWDVLIQAKPLKTSDNASLPRTLNT